MDKHTLQDDPWRMFRILAEFAEGFEAMTNLGPSVAIFGSSNEEKRDTKYYTLAQTIAKELALEGFGIISGGSFGIMEAANKGAQEGRGKSCGLCIDLPSEEGPNAFIDPNFLLKFRYFFIRKVMFVKYAQGFIFLPGGFGTLDELFESLTLIQTKKIQPFPIFLVGKSFWEPLLNWIKTSLVEERNIKPEHLELFRATDDVSEIVKTIKSHYLKEKSLENF